MRRSLHIAAVLCSSARALVAPRLRSATRLMASASGAPEDETRGGTASLADQVARARTRVGTRLRAHVERDGSVLRREVAAPTERALRSFLRYVAERIRERTTREKSHIQNSRAVRASAKGRQPALPRHRERLRRLVAQGQAGGDHGRQPRVRIRNSQGGDECGRRGLGHL